MAERKGKRSIICLSSSSEEEGKQESEVESEEEQEDDDDDDDDDDDEDDEKTSVSSFSGDGSDWSEEEENRSDDYNEDDKNEYDDDEFLCNRVIGLLKEGNDLKVSNLKECKAYLRKHGLRIAGTRPVCIERIKEHWRMKDVNVESLYPRSSFAVNCTGDVCKGDVVMFTQKVYEKFDKVTRCGKVLGTRTIAGRVVKESYGAAKQQHTFTVEVLWSKGIRKLRPLFPLLVKGRNLYKLKTFRQRWNNEAERLKVLAEKHKRGTAARLIRAMKKTKKTCANGGAKRQKQSHHTRPSQMRKTTEAVKGKHVDVNGKATSQQCAKFYNHHQVAPPPRQVNLKRNAGYRASTSWKHQEPGHVNKDRGPTLQSSADPPGNFYQSQLKYHHNNAQHPPLSSYEMGSTSTMMRLPHFPPSADTSVIPASRHQRFTNSNYIHHAHSNSSYSLEGGNLNRFPELMNVGNRFGENQSSADSPHNFYQSQIKYHHNFSSYDTGSTSTPTRLPPFGPSANTSQHQRFINSNYIRVAHSNSSYNFEGGNLNRFS